MCKTLVLRTSGQSVNSVAVNQAGASFNVLPYDDVVSCHMVILKGEILTTLMMLVMTTMMVIARQPCAWVVSLMPS